MLNFVLCDDNLPILKRLSQMLNSVIEKYDYEGQIGFEATDADSILDYVSNNHTDVLILDINLKSDISGIDLAQKVRQTNKDIYIIFTTGHLEYAMLAYKVKTFDYLAKPITKERLEETVKRLFEDVAHSTKTYVSIGKKTIVEQNEIQYIKRDGMKLVFYTNNTEYEIYSSFAKIMKDLPENFIRCHKYYIANINKIKNIETATNTITFNDSKQCFIGPKYKNDFMEVFNYGNSTNNLDSNVNT